MAPPRRRGPVLAIAVLAAVVVLLGGALAFALMRDDTPSSAATTAAVSSPTTSGLPPDGEENAREACARLGAVGDDLGSLRALGEQAAASGIPGVGGSGAMLSEVTLDAMAAAGTTEEAGRVADVKQTVVALRRACIAAGYRVD